MTASPTNAKGTIMTVSLTKDRNTAQGILFQMGERDAAYRLPEVRAFLANPQGKINDRFEFGDPHFGSRRTLVPAGSDEAHDARARFEMMTIERLLEPVAWGCWGSEGDSRDIEDFR